MDVCHNQQGIEAVLNQIKVQFPNVDKIKVRFGDSIEGDVPHSLASIKKAQKLLNYNPKIKTIDGLKKTVEWFYNNKK